MNRLTRNVLVGALAMAGGFCDLGRAESPGFEASPTDRLAAREGRIRLELDREVLASFSWRLAAASSVEENADGTVFVLPVYGDGWLDVEFDGGEPCGVTGGRIHSAGGVLLENDGQRVPLGQFVLEGSGDATWHLNSRLSGQFGEFLAVELGEVLFDSDEHGGRALIRGVVTLSAAWAEELGLVSYAGQAIGTVAALVTLGECATGSSPEACDGKSAALDGLDKDALGDPLTSGPDISVSGTQTVKWWGRSGGISAYSVSTTVCNIGDEGVDWFGLLPEHPVIAQHLYRYKNGRLEQLGQSWVKHAFVVGAPTACSGFTSCQLIDEVHLGPGCRDTYNTELNGFQSNLGPRWEVNATTGEFPYPFGVGGVPAPTTVIDRRLQVRDMDTDTALNPGALYFVEGQYVAADDAAAGNHNNNVAHQRVLRSTDLQGNPTFAAAPEAPFRGEPAILSWQHQDPFVRIEIADVPNDRRFFVASRVTQLESGLWHYEYAVHNLDSYRGARSFAVPVPDGVLLSNIGFHDVDPHSGDPRSPVDWAPTLDGLTETLTWATDSYDVDPNANALAWGTLYNFWFDADTCPTEGSTTLGLFRPGAEGDPAEVMVAASVPGEPIAVVSSFPPDRAIDARQPFAIDGSNPSGWEQVELTFSRCAAEMQAEHFAVVQEGGVPPGPEVETVEHPETDVVRISLTAPIKPLAWTRIQHVSGRGVRLGYLPADVNGDRTANPALDLSALIDCLNNPGTCFEWQANIDRLGATPGALDITRLIDLFNGAGAYDSATGATLP